MKGQTVSEFIENIIHLESMVVWSDERNQDEPVSHGGYNGMTDIKYGTSRVYHKTDIQIKAQAK